MLAIDRIVAEIAPTDIPLLLVGESGTGKEVLASRIHRLSHRKDEPFLRVACARLAPEFLQELLHGHRRGDGHIASSNAGTILMDDIDELNLAAQRILVDALRDVALTSDRPGPGARIIASTRRNLENEVRLGRFREDLYYRFSGVCIRLPPLRHRKEDLPALVDFFLARHAEESGCPKPGLSPRALSALLGYSWPGNITELDRVVGRVMLMQDDWPDVADLESAPFAEPPDRDSTQKVSLKEVARTASRQAERELILKALERTHWNRKRAARELQISYKALLYKLKQIGGDDAAESLGPRGELA